LGRGRGNVKSDLFAVAVEMDRGIWIGELAAGVYIVSAELRPI